MEYPHSINTIPSHIASGNVSGSVAGHPKYQLLKNQNITATTKTFNPNFREAFIVERHNTSNIMFCQEELRSLLGKIEGFGPSLIIYNGKM
jgi:hypothetical protein